MYIANTKCNALCYGNHPKGWFNTNVKVYYDPVISCGCNFYKQVKSVMLGQKDVNITLKLRVRKHQHRSGDNDL